MNNLSEKLKISEMLQAEYFAKIKLEAEYMNGYQGIKTKQRNDTVVAMTYSHIASKRCKMEIELIKQAIIDCQEHIQCIKINLHYDETFGHTNNIHAQNKAIDRLNITIKALEEKLERTQGCKHCTGAILGFYEVEESCNLTIIDINAKFCPKCGREILEVQDD